jgi:hypothetical protein
MQISELDEVQYVFLFIADSRQLENVLKGSMKHLLRQKNANSQC